LDSHLVVLGLVVLADAGGNEKARWLERRRADSKSAW